MARFPRFAFPVVALVAVAIAVVVFLPRRPRAPRPGNPNILLVTIDTLRADHASCCGYARPTMPRLERLAAEGALFCHAYCPVPTTAPSHATMLTGQYALVHGVVKNGYTLGPEHETLTERLRAAGYATAAVTASFPVNSRFGLAQGFDLYDDEFPIEGSSYPMRTFEGFALTGGFDRRAAATATRALTWLERERPPERPFFLWVHFFDPHAPYDPPAPYDRAFAATPDASPTERTIAAYDGEVRYTDEHLGRLLDALEKDGLSRNTIVVVVSDHGEGLGQHGFFDHGMLLYEEAVRVPLVIRWPGQVRAGQNVTSAVPLVDLAPTLMDLAGVPTDGQAMAGRSLARVLRGEEKADPKRPIFLQRRYYEPGSKRAPKIKGLQYGVRVGGYKLIEAPEDGVTELYDLASDPGELRNVAAEQPDRTRELKALLLDWVRLAPAFSRQEVSLEDAARLRALGYFD
jgi:arylsulfatase A-like enzyme